MKQNAQQYHTQRDQRRAQSCCRCDVGVGHQASPALHPCRILALILVCMLVGCASGSKAQERSLAQLRASFESGQYQQVEQAITERLATDPHNGALLNLRGEIYLATGRYAEALQDFQMAAQHSHGAEAWRAKLNMGQALLARGQTDEAQALFRQFISLYNSGQTLNAELLTLIARALVHLEYYHDANDLFLDAIAADPNALEAHLCAGELYIEKYNYAEAAQFFRDALKVNPNSARAHLGLARSQQMHSEAQVEQHLARALSLNPNLVDAHLERATRRIELDQFDEALNDIEQALRVNPHSLPARALRAAIFHLQNRPDEFRAEEQRALAVNPRGGEFYLILAESAVTHRRYHSAVGFARRAVELSPRLWKAHATLGINLLRTGQYAEGRAALEKAFAGDPFNIWTKNTLDLLDSMRDYRETMGRHFLVKAAPQESEILGPLALELLEEAYEKLTAKYQFKPRGPIIVELFANHDDFAVRTLGLPGLGALGACFGQVIAMDSPSARPLGQFNWGSTLWHEFVHVITLQITDYKIPRWFSEGLSVYEERRARPGWGDDWTLDYLQAFVEGRFLPIAELDAGFLRPRSPEQISLAYFQASLVCEFIEETFGFSALLKLLGQYRQDATTSDALKHVLGLNPPAFDAAFRAFVERQTAAYRKAVDFAALRAGHRALSPEACRARLTINADDFVAHWRLGLAYQAEGQHQKAIEHLSRAVTVFPFYTGEANPYLLLADLYQQQGKPAEAIAVLEKLVNLDEDHWEAHDRLARLLVERGEGARAMAIFQRGMYIAPLNAAWQERAGECFLQHQSPERALRAFQAMLALNPPDKALAYYNVARAWLALARPTEAKRAVLQSLEIAPSFEKAQQLLLQLTK
ncbi:MAG: tetratricopeptide repeat protein [Acidobacteriota bacterium]|nr:tetratricopeptide repeat protein [Blastocatellia bacterium]MDW8241131.1 tetratricopeptide repeat protein [Acidobacteriota bacterium]